LVEAEADVGEEHLVGCLSVANGESVEKVAPNLDEVFA